MRIFIVIAVLVPLFLTGFASEARAAKTFLQVVSELFEGDKPKEPDPSVTLQAPFAYDPKRVVEQGKDLPVNAVPMDMPHRTSKEIAQWLMVIVSDLLTFRAGALEEDLAAEQIYLAPSGQSQYREFLRANSMLQVLETGRYHMQAIVSNTPLLINEAAQGGVYRWLYEVPAIVSYIDASGFDYKKSTPVSQTLKLTIQLRRVPPEAGLGDKEGVAIEIWRGSAESLDKP